MSYAAITRPSSNLESFEHNSIHMRPERPRSVKLKTQPRFIKNVTPSPHEIKRPRMKKSVKSSVDPPVGFGQPHRPVPACSHFDL